SAFAYDSFDFIVVGGGTSGLVVASRLAENPAIRVGIIEAGKYRPHDPKIDVPQGSGYLGNPDYDWLMSSVPQRGAVQFHLPENSGKLVGGSSSINAMVWQRGAREDYDAWSQTIGNDKSWSGLLPYFKKTENWTPPTLRLPNNHISPRGSPWARWRSDPGSSGQTAISISYANYLTDVDIPCVTAANQLGLALNDNPDGGNSTGFPLVARSVSPTTGARSYAAPGYFTPDLEKSNLVLLTEAQVTRVNFVKGSGKTRASGVDFLVGDKICSVAAKEVILAAAGSLKTPQLLELSGVGNAKLLSSLGISSVLDLPQVGENLQVSVFSVGLDSFGINPDARITLFVLLNSEFARGLRTWVRNHFDEISILVDYPVPLQDIVNASRAHSLLAGLDNQISSMHLTPLQKAQYKFQKNLVAEGKVGTVGFTVVPVGGIAAPPQPKWSYVSIVAVAMHPFSRGSVYINSRNATQMPAIDVGYLNFDFVIIIRVEGLKFNHKWSETAPFSVLVQNPIVPAANISSDDDVKRQVRRPSFGCVLLIGHHHGVGIVNSDLKVYGIENVRVVDAGIIPMMVTGTISSTVYAVAEKVRRASVCELLANRLT
ncbi:hypothetical protein C8R47DRAFT_961254, partial [Mycena vitilis]